MIPTSGMIVPCPLVDVSLPDGNATAVPRPVEDLVTGEFLTLSRLVSIRVLMSSSAPPAERSDDRRPADDMSNASDRGGDRRGNGGGPEPGATNTGTNLFVTGIHPRLTEDDVMRLFAKYGEVEKCQIMLDPHTKESRGFGFVKMATLESADGAKEGLQGEAFEGRTLSIEKARRSRPRTPTPGKYFGPPKRGSYSPNIDAFKCALLT